MDSEKLAHKIRIDCLEMVHHSHASHIGSALSVVDILSVLYSYFLNIDPCNAHKSDRDILIMSKGHAGVAIYATLAEEGFFSREMLDSYYQNGSILSGHVSHKVNGVEFSTGSLGHGLPVACGFALGKILKNQKGKVYVICGDGEMNEGSNWEAFMNAKKLELNNLVCIIDRNSMQAMGKCVDILNLEPLDKKIESFGWNVVNIKNGHSHEEIFNVFKEINQNQSCPLCVIANTIKGKGISFMENNILWHYRDPQGEFYEKAKQELKDYVI